jgi:hypothetical protein
MSSTGNDGELVRNESVGHYKGAPGDCRTPARAAGEVGSPPSLTADRGGFAIRAGGA